MKALVVIFPGFVDFEISVLTCYLRMRECEVHTVGAETKDGTVSSMAGFQVVPHLAMEEVNPDDYEALIIPGGQHVIELKDEKLLDLVREFDRRGKILAAICAGPVLLARAGVLAGKRFSTSVETNHDGVFEWDNRTDFDVTADGRIITAKGQAYVEFAMEVIRKLGLFKNGDEERETFAFFKNRK
jgi:putative intracellular protease/amidase